MGGTRSNEVPPENKLRKYIDIISILIGGVSAGSLYLRDVDLFLPEIIMPFCSILMHRFVQDMLFSWNTKRYSALCYRNTFLIMGALVYLYYNPKLWCLKPVNAVLACASWTCVYHFVDRYLHAKCEREERLLNGEVFTLNSGSMLAYGFYYGYLKLILPGGRGLKGVKEKIDDFINYHEGRNERFRELFPVKKLFILIPSSSFSSYDEPDFGSGMEPAQPLEEHTENRALTRDRVYKNTVWVVTNKAANKKYYVLPEMATPTKTLYEICKEQKHVAQYKEEIVSSFYYTLQRLLDEDPTCGRACELIYYKDSGRSSDRVNLADIIIKRIEENIRKEN